VSNVPRRLSRVKKQSEMLGTNAVRLENVQPYHIFTLSYRLAGVQWHLAQGACIMPLSFQIGKCLDSGDIDNLSVYMSQQLPLVIVFFVSTRISRQNSGTKLWYTDTRIFELI